MGDTMSTPSVNEAGEENVDYVKNLVRKISEDIASGNEGDIVDMQIRNELDPKAPHLYWHPLQEESVSIEKHESLASEDENKMLERSLTTASESSQESSLKNEDLQIQKAKDKLIKKQLSSKNKQGDLEQLQNPESIQDEGDNFTQFVNQ